MTAMLDYGVFPARSSTRPGCMPGRDRGRCCPRHRPGMTWQSTYVRRQPVTARWGRRADRWRVAGSSIGVDGGRCRTVRGVDEHHRCSGRADRRSGEIRGSGAYETAFSATVPPPVIAANRAQLASLVATNVVGQNTPAIMANEATYAEMWAQDAGAMYGYAGLGRRRPPS